MSLTSFQHLFRILTRTSGLRRAARKVRSSQNRYTQLGLENFEQRLAMTTLLPVAAVDFDPGHHEPIAIVSQGPVFRADYAPVHLGLTGHDGSGPTATARTADQPTATARGLGLGSAYDGSQPVEAVNAPKTYGPTAILDNGGPTHHDPRPVYTNFGPVNTDPQPVHSDPGPVNSDPRPLNSDPRAVHSDPRPVISDPRPVATGEFGTPPGAVSAGPVYIAAEPRAVSDATHPTMAVPKISTPTSFDPRPVAHDLALEQIFAPRAKAMNNIIEPVAISARSIIEPVSNPVNSIIEPVAHPTNSIIEPVATAVNHIIEPVATIITQELAAPRFTLSSDAILGQGDPRPVGLYGLTGELPRALGGDPVHPVSPVNAVNSGEIPGIFARTAVSHNPVFTVTHNPVMSANETAVYAKAVKS